MKKIIILLYISSFSIYSAELAQTFIIKFRENNVKVLSPSKYEKKLSLIIENKTLVKLIGKIEGNYGKVLGHLAVESQGNSSFELNLEKQKELYFVPISPPFQKIKLIVGKDSYEIPPKK